MFSSAEGQRCFVRICAGAAARARLARQLELLGRRGDSGLHWLGSSLAARGYLDLSPLLVAASGVRERRCIARFFLGTSNVPGPCE